MFDDDLFTINVPSDSAYVGSTLIREGKVIPQEAKDLAFLLLECPENTSEEAKQVLLAYMAKLGLEQREYPININKYLDINTVSKILERAANWGDYKRKQYNFMLVKTEILNIATNFVEKWTEK